MRVVLYKKLFLYLLALNFIIPQAHAAEMCQYIFANPAIKPRAVDFGLARGTQQNTTPVELVKFKETRDQLRLTLQKLPKDRAENIQNLLSAVEFFDYQHTAPKLLDNFINGRRERMDFSRLYDTDMELFNPSAPFKGFLAARNYLINQRPEVSPELLLDLHKLIMKDGVEGVQPGQLGQWRNGHWVGNAAGPARITKSEQLIIEENPYLYFVQKNVEKDNSNNSIWSKVKIWAEHKNTVLESQSNDLISGTINYPNVLKSPLKTLEVIKDSHPEIFQKLIATRESVAQGITLDGPAKQQLEAQFTKALIEERFSRFNQQRQQLGKVQIGLNEHQYIDLVASFQRDLVAIHPLFNGNGRTTRLFMNYLLTREGLPPVRLVDPYLDVQVAPDKWAEYVHKGVLNTAQLYKDVLFRVENGLTVEYSPELLYPGLSETVGIALKKQNSKEVRENYARAKVEGEQFNAFVKTLFEMHPELKTELAQNRLKTMSRIADLFTEYYRSKTIRYIHDKDGERTITLRLVETDFVDTFAVPRAYNKTLWDNKISKWYDKDMLVWRGLSNRQAEYTNEQLLQYFRAPTSHLVSNRVLNRMRQGHDILNAIKMDFNDFNKEMINGKMVDMAIDHHRSGPMYGMSYGYSTSKREVVGKAFAMGAMVVGEYGKHMDPTLQAQLKSRINVASFRAFKDVDLGRLKAFDPEFSYTYGRQAEVMGIGGTDPDAVMLIQRLDATGNVTQTLLRNLEKPNEVLVINGRFVPGEGKTLTADMIVDRLTIHKEMQTETQAPPTPKEESSGNTLESAKDRLKDFFNRFQR